MQHVLVATMPQFAHRQAVVRDQRPQALPGQQARPDRIDSMFEQPDVRRQIRDIQSRLMAEKIDWKALA